MPLEFSRALRDEVCMRRRARPIGPDCEAVVGRVFSDVRIREQAYNPVMTILNLSKAYGDEALESAYSYAFERGLEHARSRFLRSVLASGAWRAAEVGRKDAREEGGYVRGAGGCHGEVGRGRGPRRGSLRRPRHRPAVGAQPRPGGEQAARGGVGRPKSGRLAPGFDLQQEQGRARREIEAGDRPAPAPHRPLPGDIEELL